MMKKGRPFGSKIRQNLIEILFYIEKGYGYQLQKIYCQVFSECSSELIYYHLKKGVSLDEFAVEEVKIETGDFSWGPSSRKIIYKLGSNAKPSMNLEIKKTIDEIKSKNKNNNY